jgi:hypothetical protein
MGTLGLIQDISRAPVRGVEGLFRGAVGFADWVLFDALPDSWKERRLGRSESLPGGLIEGMTHFGLGFALAGKVFAAKALAGTAVGKLSAGAAAGAAAGKKTSLAMAGHSALKGVMADGIFMNPEEDRMSNLLSEYGILSSVTDFLAAGEDDSEAMGRLKNVLEGLGMSAFMETIGITSRVLRGRAPDGTVRLSPADSVEVQQALSRAVSRKSVEDSFKELSPVKLQEVAEIFASGKEKGTREIFSALKKAGVDPESLTGNPKTALTRAAQPEMDARTANTVVVNNKLTQASPERFQEITSTIDRLRGDASVSDSVRQAMAPVRQYLEEAQIALKHVPGDPSSGRPQGTMNPEMLAREVNDRLALSVAELVESKGFTQEQMMTILDETIIQYKSVITETNFTELFNSPAYRESLDGFVRSITGNSIDEQVRAVSSSAADIGSRMQDLVIETAVLKEVSNGLAKKFYGDLGDAFEAALTGARNADDAMRIVEGDSSRLFDILQAVADTRYWWGLGLRSTAMDPTSVHMYASRSLLQNGGDAVTGITRGKEPGSQVFREVLSALGIDRKPTRASLERIRKLATDENALQALERGIHGTGGAHNGHAFLTVYRSALLSNPATNIFNATSTIVRHISRDLEHMVGAKMGALVTRDPVLREQYNQMFASAAFGLREFFTARTEAVAGFKRAWNNHGRGTLTGNQGSRMDNLEGASRRYDPFEVRSMMDHPEGTRNAFQTILDTIQSGKHKIHNNIMPIIATPGRLMGATDEGLKAASFKSVVSRDFHYRGVRQGLKGAELETYIRQGVDRSTVGSIQAVSEEAYMAQARRVAQAEFNGRDDITPSEFRKRVTDLYDQLSPTRQAELKFAQNQALEASGTLAPGRAKSLFEADMDEAGFLFQTSLDAQRVAIEDAFQTPLSSDRSFMSGLAEQLARAETEGSALARFALGTSLPFIRTPYNVMSFMMDFAFAPVRAANDTVAQTMARLKGAPSIQRTLFEQADILRGAKQGDSRAQARAVEYFGRLSASTAAWGVGLGLYQSGAITGSPPRDPDERALWQSAGNQANSIKIGDTWVSYTKIAPLNFMFGLIADMGEALEESIETTEGGSELGASLGMAAVIAFANNFTDKTFLTNFNTLLENMVSPDENKLDRIVTTIGTPLLAPQIVQAFTRNITDTESVRETRNMADMVLGRTPGSHRGIDVRRNGLGEQVPRNAKGPGLLNMVNPLYMSNIPEKDQLLAELITLNEPIRRPAPVVGDGTLDMRDYTVEDPELGGQRSVYDRRLGLMSTIEIRGMTVRQALEQVINDPRYLALPRDGAFDGLNDPRTLVIRRIIEPFREASLQQTLAENPNFLDLYQRHVMSAQAVRQGSSPIDARAMFGLR